MLMIINFSLENSEKSSETSSGLIRDVLDTVLGEENVTDELVSQAQVPIRKIAHFGVYMLLGFTLMNLFYLIYSMRNLKIFYFCPIAIGVSYSIFDEHFIQKISNGRAPSWVDVLIDSAGVFVGICLFFLLIFIVYKLKNNKQRI